jgi:long-subunit fatty acid transport protein
MQKAAKVVESLSLAMAKRFVFPVILALILILAWPQISRGQLVLGQYEDEAPLRTWNIFGFHTASSLGRADTSFALGSDISAALTNPALLLSLPRFTATFNGTASSASLYKFSIINTGVFSTSDNISLNLYALDFAGVSFKSSGWAVGLAVYLSEIYDRPQASYEYQYRGELAYTLDFHQTGLVRNFSLALARKISSRIQAGLGLTFFSGDLSREIKEDWLADGFSISDTKKEEFSGFFANAGILVRVTEKLDLALVGRTAYKKKASVTSELVYDAPSGGTEIRIAAEATNTYEQPLVAGLGACYRFSPQLKAAADVAFFNWASYRVRYFDEELSRDFRNTIKASLGAEYAAPVRLFNKEAAIPIRVGIGYDEQPMKEPLSAYTYFSAGAGLSWSIIRLDFGASFGRESGSGNALTTRRIALSLTLKL